MIASAIVQGRFGLKQHSDGACRNGMLHREKLTLQSGLDTLGLGEIKKGMRPRGDIPGEPRTDGIFRPAAC
jgi:hypothetical protein